MIINETTFTTSLTDILGELRNQLKLNGIQLLGTIRDTPDNVMVSCPYHKGGQERRPSAGIHKDTGTFHCFACGETHSLPEVISFCFGKEDDIVGAFGWTWLLKNFLTISVEDRRPIQLNLDRNRDKPVQTFVSEEELDSYRQYHPYMWQRKMTPETVEIFDIGYDTATKCLTFPVRDVNGNTLFIARRSVQSKFFNYPNGSVKPVYGLYELYHFANPFPSAVIVCESMIDAITCWVYGKYAVALNGLGDELQFRQLENLPCRKLILATDNDSAGQKARARLRANIRGKLITEYILPAGKKDINDLTEEEFNRLPEKLAK